MEQKKISVAMIANNLEVNGISSVIINYCSHLNLGKFMITILVGAAVTEINRKKCEELGIEVVELPHRKTNTLAFYRELNSELKKKRYDIAHVHGSHAAIAVELFLAWINGIKVRIAHSHNTTCTNMKVHKLMLPLFNCLYTNGFACGEEAGLWLFGKRKFNVVPNGFYTEKFSFNSSVRNEMRRELGLAGKYVLGHIGRFNDQKNHRFLLKVFESVAKKREDSVLLLIGKGPDFEAIKGIIAQHPYKERIIVYGESPTPERMYMAMDVFVFPSKFEGLPVTLLEAQIGGLPCVISDVITQEAILGDRVKSLSLNKNAAHWANEINSLKPQDREQFYSDFRVQIENYGITDCALKLEQKYISLLGLRKN
ncbi:glycosyltransferase involved in cell wall biosynthesis [Bacillus sp. SORGH_AS 510]|uniref:glycosyltransferase family 1 protein n=1 Tax=Bacillus sp. SORGH_AS_0510 TaxID=3041771 RepID=UPI00278674E4|nr:glycosyltransferase family 1 protein [Bacillus sp. SORGH_AS_0510]MDQ1143762.1 glycosyltransferase involved in cell wall biosynthesis [Bacillus sp. SORGH_AS_0510]